MCACWCLGGWLSCFWQLGPKLLVAAAKANAAITSAAEMLKAREDRQHKNELERAHRNAITELTACKQRLEELKATVSRNGIHSDEMSQAIAKAEVRLSLPPNVAVCYALTGRARWRIRHVNTSPSVCSALAWLTRVCLCVRLLLLRTSPCWQPLGSLATHWRPTQTKAGTPASWTTSRAASQHWLRPSPVPLPRPVVAARRRLLPPVPQRRPGRRPRSPASARS